MMINQLVPGELAIMRALEDQRPRGTIEIANRIDLPAWAVRSMAKALARRGVVRRCRDYRWEITQRGLDELILSRQLRIVS